MNNEQFRIMKKAFLKEQLKKDDIKLFDNGKLNEEAVKVAIDKAYEDSQPRLIVGHSQLGNDIWEWDAIKYLKKQIKKFFDEDNMSFDNWHKTTAELFLTNYNSMLREKIDNNQNVDQNMGKAQKIINMTLKYLYCMEYDEETIGIKFEKCHMAIDSYTLEWYFRVPNYIMENGEKKKQLSKTSVGCWSKMSEEHYHRIQKNIVKYLQEEQKVYIIDSKKMTPLQAEFIIWEEEKLRLALLGLTGRKSDYNDKRLSVLINELEEKINQLKATYICSDEI